MRKVKSARETRRLILVGFGCICFLVTAGCDWSSVYDTMGPQKAFVSFRTPLNPADPRIEGGLLDTILEDLWKHKHHMRHPVEQSPIDHEDGIFGMDSLDDGGLIGSHAQSGCY